MPQFIGSFTPLTGSGGATPAYVSPWVVSDFWATITGSVFADQAGTLVVEQSADMINADVATSTPIVASTGVSFNVPLVLAFVRVRTTNTSVTAQTVLRLKTRFNAGNNPT